MADQITERFEEFMERSHPFKQARDVLAGCRDAIMGVASEIPAEAMGEDGVALINAVATVVELARAEFDTQLKAEALVHATGGAGAA